MAEVELECAVYGEGTVFPVKIARDAKVSALQMAIADRYKVVSNRVEVYPATLTLYLAKKNGTWLKSDPTLKPILKQGRQENSDYEEMIPNWILDEDYLGVNFKPGRKEIHVLVELPEAAAGVEPMRRSVFWLVTGSVENALHTRGVRSRIYRIADAELGYYDPTNVFADDKVQAFWYANNDLQIHVLFEEKMHALYFQSRLNAEFITIPITSFVSQVRCPKDQQRIFSRDYVADDSESPQETMSSIPNEFSVIDTDNPVFKYQRIEADGFFGPYGKAESAHLISKSHCLRIKSYNKYDDDDNNRLALSREMHGAYDKLNFVFPVVNMEVVSVSHGPVMDNRFKVELNVSVYSQDYAFLLQRLKDESTRTSDPLVMKTFVHVENPTIFCKCMAWKYKEVEKLRQSYFDMKPAVN